MTIEWWARPRVGEGEGRPGIGAFEVRDLHERCDLGERGVSRKEPDDPVTLAGRVAADPGGGKLLAEIVVLGADELAGSVVGPTVIKAHEVAVLDASVAQLDVSMGATVLEDLDQAVFSAEDCDVFSGEARLDHLLALHLVAERRGVPMVGVHPDLARLVCEARARGLLVGPQPDQGTALHGSTFTGSDRAMQSIERLLGAAHYHPHGRPSFLSTTQPDLATIQPPPSTAQRQDPI